MRIRLVSRNAVREVDDSCRPLAHEVTTAGAMETVGWQLLPCRRGAQWARDPLELPCNGTESRLTR